MGSFVALGRRAMVLGGHGAESPSPALQPVCALLHIPQGASQHLGSPRGGFTGPRGARHGLTTTGRHVPGHAVLTTHAAPLRAVQPCR